jgi:hypothetical protein
VLEFDPERVRQNVRQAATEDLLDRITVYAAGMESQALDIIERELRSRGVNREEIDAHQAERAREVITLPDGTAARCSFCHRPSVAQGWGWHRLWGLVPVFPRYYDYCDRHRPAPEQAPSSESPS